MVEGLEVIPGLYTYAATAIVAGALAFVAGWQTQEWRYGKQIAGIQAQHATALASANQKALDDTIKMQRAKDEAIKAAQDRAKTEAANAANARADADRLRAQLDGVPARLASATDGAVREYASAASVVFARCVGAYQELAGVADGHAADVRTLSEAWPVIPPRPVAGSTH